MKLNVLIGIVAVLGANAAVGQGREGPGAIFDRADRNDDGVIAREEFLATRAEQFGSRDRNSDGFIDNTDLGERAAARPRASQAMSALITQFDVDRDGKINKEEFVNGGARLFDRADSDKSASLDAKELEAAKATLRERAGR